MKIFPDCMPCMLRQVLEVARLATDDAAIHEKIMKQALRESVGYERYGCPPDFCESLQKIVQNFTGEADPYERTKQNDIEAAKKTLPCIRRFLKEKGNSLYWTLKASAVGNIMDPAVLGTIDIEASVEKELKREFAVCDIVLFENRLENAKSLLIIGDNAGETVFDTVLAEYFSNLDVTYAVRSEPILNDATEKEAYASGLGECTKIMQTGSKKPGTDLLQCSDAFVKRFNTADIVISKGQGNYESLDAKREVFYLLKAKCPVIAGRFQVGPGEYVFWASEASRMAIDWRKH